MLILDEATSSIDTRTELMIQEAFARMMEGRTSFIVAHCLSTIREADCILVMRSGQVVEQGRHEELFEKGGFYASCTTASLPKQLTPLCGKTEVDGDRKSASIGSGPPFAKTFREKLQKPVDERRKLWYDKDRHKHGVVSEWFKELVLKTSDSQEPWVRIPPSPPTSIYEATSQYTLSVTMRSTQVGDEAPLLRA